MLILFHNILLLNNIVQTDIFSQKSFNDKIDNEQIKDEIEGNQQELKNTNGSSKNLDFLEFESYYQLQYF